MLCTFVLEFAAAALMPVPVPLLLGVPAVLSILDLAALRLPGRPPPLAEPATLLGRDVFADGDRDGVYAQDSGCAASSTVELMS